SQMWLHSLAVPPPPRQLLERFQDSAPQRTRSSAHSAPLVSAPASCQSSHYRSHGHTKLVACRCAGVPAVYASHLTRGSGGVRLWTRSGPQDPGGRTSAASEKPATSAAVRPTAANTCDSGSLRVGRLSIGANAASAGAASVHTSSARSNAWEAGG